MTDDAETLSGAALFRAAAFFSRQPGFLGYWLEVYREARDLEPATLAQQLGRDVETLGHLCLCLRPRPERLFEDMAALAERYGIDQDRLYDVLHDAETYQAVKAASPPPGHPPEGARHPATGTSAAPSFGAQPGFAAASDREPEPEQQGPHGTPRRAPAEREEEANGG